MRLSKQNYLLIAVLVGETLCILFGAIWFARWLDQTWTTASSRQVLSNNTIVASQFARIVEQMDLQNVLLGSREWERVQAAVEEAELPNEGYLTVTRTSTGALICHPNLGDNPELAKTMPGQIHLNDGVETHPIVKWVATQGGARGTALVDGDRCYVAVRQIPNLDLNVIAHQRHALVRRSITRAIWTSYGLGLVILVSVLLATAYIGHRVIPAYQQRLVELKEEDERTFHARVGEMTKTRNATIFGLAKLAESRDTDTGDHLDRIREYVMLLAGAMQEAHDEIDDAFIHDLGFASSLHDIGKVGIPDEILLKPGRLTPDERKVIERHAVIGGECLAAIEAQGEDDFLHLARTIAYSHHERWDGSGYPHGLKEADIPLAARIVAVADVYDALTSKRPYKEAMDHQAARDLIVAESGSHFDPDVINAFIAQENEFALRSDRSESENECRENAEHRDPDEPEDELAAEEATDVSADATGKPEAGEPDAQKSAEAPEPAQEDATPVEA